MTYSDFMDWKANPCTKEVMAEIRSECYEIARVLAVQAGLDSLNDRYQAGVIRGMERILEVDYQPEIDFDPTLDV